MKLELNKETVRLLTEAETHIVVGGSDSSLCDPSTDAFGFLSRWGSVCDSRPPGDTSSRLLCFRF